MSTDTPTKPKKRGIMDVAVGRSNVYDLPPHLIHIKEGWNARDWSSPENVEHVRTLAGQIQARGRVERPVTIYAEDGRYYVSDGECRLRAVAWLEEEAGIALESVPVVLEDKSTDDAERMAAMFIRNGGKDFSALEKAALVRRLVEMGKTVEWIAGQIGATSARVRQLQEVAALPDSVREKVAEGVVSATEAARVVREHGEDAPAVIERAAASTVGQGGKKAGRATRASLEAATKPQDAPKEPEDTAPDPVAELLEENQRLQGEIARLTALVEALQKDDTTREVTRLHAERAQLNANNLRLNASLAEARRESQHRGDLLKKIRKMLGVDTDREILPVLEGLTKELGDE